MKYGLGHSSNNAAELRATNILVSFGSGVRDTPIFGDSKLVISWLEGTMEDRSLDLHGAFK